MEVSRRIKITSDLNNPLLSREEKISLLRELRGGSPKPVEPKNGIDGYTPIKGKDYWTPSELQEVVSFIQSKVKDGKDGMDGTSIVGPMGPMGLPGPRGPQGIPGYTPQRGIDYFTASDQETMVSVVLSLIPKAKDGISPSIQSIVDEVRKTPIDFNDLKGTEEVKGLVEFLKRGGFRGGGSSGGGSSGVTSFNGRTGVVTLTSLDVTTALGYSPLNPGGFSTGSVIFSDGITLVQDNTNFVYTTAGGLRIGPSNPDITPQNKFSVVDNVNDYHGIFVENASNGNLASTDIVVSNDLGTSTGNYADFGVNSSTNTNPAFTAFAPSDAYLFTTGSLNNLVIANGTAGKRIDFVVGGTLASNRVSSLTSVGMGWNTVSPTAGFHGVAKAATGATTFVGTGLNNMTTSGSYTGDTSSTYKIVIALVNSPFTGTVSAAGTGYVVGDLVTISTGGANHIVRVTGINGSGGVTGLSVSTQGSGYTTGIKATTGGTGTGFTFNITAVRDYFTSQKDSSTISSVTAITGSAQTIAEGISVTFATTTGHTTNDQWSIAVTSTDSMIAYDSTSATRIFRVSNTSVYANRIYMTRGSPSAGNGYLFDEGSVFPKTGVSTTGMWQPAGSGSVVIGASGVAGITVAAGTMSLGNVGAGGVASISLTSAGVTISHLLLTASTTAIPSLVINTGVAPTGSALVDGAIWFDGTDIKMRVGGVTKTFTLV